MVITEIHGNSIFPVDTYMSRNRAISGLANSLSLIRSQTIHYLNQYWGWRMIWRKVCQFFHPRKDPWMYSHSVTATRVGPEHYGDDVSRALRSLKSLATWLFIQQSNQAINKENIKVSHFCLFRGPAGNSPCNELSMQENFPCNDATIEMNYDPKGTNHGSRVDFQVDQVQIWLKRF